MGGVISVASGISLPGTWSAPRGLGDATSVARLVRGARALFGIGEKKKEEAAEPSAERAAMRGARARKGRGRLVGVDIGASAIKMVELVERPTGLALQRFGVAPLGPEVIVEGEIADRAALVAAIKRVAAEMGLKTKRVATCISSNTVIIKKINMPPMTPHALEESIPIEAQAHVPYNIDDIYLDFQVLGPAPPDGAEDQVLLVAAKKDFVEAHRGVLTEAGLEPVIVDVDAFAIENAYETNYGAAPQEVVALLDLGASMMRVNVLSGGFTAFTRDVAVGGRLFTDEIQRQWNLSFEAAEELKLGGSLEAHPDIDQIEFENFLINQEMALVSEVENSFEFFMATPFGAPVTKILLTGGGARFPGLTEFLADRIAIPVEVLDPFHGITWDEATYTADYLHEVAPLLSVGVGLALRREE